MSGQLVAEEKTVRDILESKEVVTFFQPVVSISTKSIIGFEAFSRAGSQACAVAPKVLFHKGLTPQTKIEVDRLCRERALQQFKPIHEKHRNLILFLNINPDIFPHVGEASMVLHDQVKAAGLNPANIVLECSITPEVLDPIAEYSQLFRKEGYKLCFDNCSVDDAFSHILSRVKPHFVKVDRSFFAEGERKEYSTRTLAAVLDVAARMGTRVVGQRIETEEESLRLLAAGLHLQQGYYYTKDETVKSDDPAALFFKKIEETHTKYKAMRKEMVRRKKDRVRTAFRLVTAICSKFASLTEDRFEEGCYAMVKSSPDVYSAMIMDGDGMQLTKRVHARDLDPVNTGDILGFRKGSDHSVEDYVIYLNMGYERFVTPPFTSPFTGESACFITRPFFSQDGLRYIACIEVHYPG